ncbi:MAG: hypothetical protein GY751_05925 [Bacteroidetes bacterium]|nr:hypothetical protein [Bacteroidota bacterium]
MSLFISGYQKTGNRTYYCQPQLPAIYQKEKRASGGAGNDLLTMLMETKDEDTDAQMPGAFKGRSREADGGGVSIAELWLIFTTKKSFKRHIIFAKF